MKKTIFVILPFIFIFNFIGCATNNLVQNENFVHGEQRFFEETGGFSITIPRMWHITNMPSSRYRVIRGPSENGFAPPLIVFSIDTFDGSLDLMTDTVIAYLILLAENFRLIYRSEFETLNNLNGERMIITYTVHGQEVRQVIYSFLGIENNMSIMISCTVVAEAGELFDERFDRMAKTFEWATQ